MLQRRLGPHRNLTPSNMHEVQDQLNDLLQKNRKPFRTRGMSLDFMGKEGMTRTIRSLFSGEHEPAISNLVIEDTGHGPRLVITGMSLLRPNKDQHSSTLSG